MSKEERATLAIQKRTQEIREQKSKEEKQKKERDEFEREADALRWSERNHQSDGKYGRGGRSEHVPATLRSGTLLVFIDDDRQHDGRRNQRDRRDKRHPHPDDERPRQSGPAFKNGVPTGPRADRGRGATNATPSTSGPQGTLANEAGLSIDLTEASSNFVPQMNDDELSAIRTRYLGVDKKKRKIRKMNDRKFVFDWDEHEDTFENESPLAVGGARQGAQVMFGRGHLAGMDDTGGGSTRETNEKLADGFERRRAARHGRDERHWKDKPLSEMKERDWRIFREDFSIAARGLRHPLILEFIR